jgi:hypothetical protein
MILGFKQHLYGEPTHFKEKILACVMPKLAKKYKPKRHSIRAGNRWRAKLPIHMAYGVRSSLYDQFNKDIPALQRCISVQDVFITYEGYGLPEITVDDSKYLVPHEVELLVENDGLTMDQFIQFFFNNQVGCFSGQIIHWTGLKY